MANTMSEANETMNKQMIASEPVPQSELEPEHEPDSRSYTENDDIKENLDCNTGTETDDTCPETADDDDDVKHPDTSSVLLPVGLLPKYTQTHFISDEDEVEKTSPIYGW